MRICVLDDYQAVAERYADWSSLGPEASVDFISTPIAPGDAALRLAPYDVLVAMRERMAFPEHLLRQLPNLKLLVTTGPRNRAIDLNACNQLGISVSGTRSDGALAAELSWALVMALYKRIPANDADVRAGRWQTNIATSLKGSTLGLIGLGKLGQRMARFAHAFDMHVVAWSPHLSQERCEPFGVEYVSKHELLQRSDVVSIHMVLSESTRHIISAPDLDLMKTTAYLVNTSRSGLIDETALCAALHNASIAGAALDVFDHEPITENAALLRTPNTIVSPHMGYVTEQNYQTYFSDAVANIQSWRAGIPLRLLTQ